MATRLGISKVRMKKLNRQVIRAYFKVVNPLDKAGAYAIQEHGEMLIDGVEGSYSNVIGLPLEELAKLFSSIPALSHLVPRVKAARAKLPRLF